MSKVMGICVTFSLFLRSHSLNMVMSFDPACKFRQFSFCPNSTLNFTKSHKISIGKALYFRNYQSETSRGGGGGGG